MDSRYILLTLFIVPLAGGQRFRVTVGPEDDNRHNGRSPSPSSPSPPPPSPPSPSPSSPSPPSTPSFSTFPSHFPSRSSISSAPSFSSQPSFPSHPTIPSFSSRSHIPSGPGFSSVSSFPSRSAIPSHSTHPSLPSFPSHPSWPSVPSWSFKVMKIKREIALLDELEKHYEDVDCCKNSVAVFEDIDYVEFVESQKIQLALNRNITLLQYEHLKRNQLSDIQTLVFPSFAEFPLLLDLSTQQKNDIQTFVSSGNTIVFTSRSPSAETFDKHLSESVITMLNSLFTQRWGETNPSSENAQLVEKSVGGLAEIKIGVDEFVLPLKRDSVDENQVLYENISGDVYVAHAKYFEGCVYYVGYSWAHKGGVNVAEEHSRSWDEVLRSIVNTNV